MFAHSNSRAVFFVLYRHIKRFGNCLNTLNDFLIGLVIIKLIARHNSNLVLVRGHLIFNLAQLIGGADTDIEFTADGNGYIWRAAEGDNSLYIEKIDNNLYYYYQSY